MTVEIYPHWSILWYVYKWKTTSLGNMFASDLPSQNELWDLGGVWNKHIGITFPPISKEWIQLFVIYLTVYSLHNPYSPNSNFVQC